MLPDLVPTNDNTIARVLIFDWDDTICPSSFVDRWQIDNIQELPHHFQKLFSELAICAERCLEEASRYGEVIIITNSDDGWVKYSAERFVPKLLPVLEKYAIVSARTEYEQFYPNQPLCWKAAAFAHEVNEIYNTRLAAKDASRSPVKQNSTSIPSNDFEKADCDGLESTDVSSVSSASSRGNSSCSSSGDLMVIDQEEEQDQINEKQTPEVISFGDSMEERIAVQIISRQLSAVSKSVMFIQTPNPIQLIGQLQMITSHMKYMCERPSTLDLEISTEQAERYATRYMKQHHCEYFEKMIISEDRVALAEKNKKDTTNSAVMTDNAVTANVLS